MNLLEQLQKNPKTFNHFKQWLFEKLGKNQQNLIKFGTYPPTFQILYIIEYLELWGVNILGVLSYYNCLSSNQASSFQELLSFMIIHEFNRIEQDKEINYTPF